MFQTSKEYKESMKRPIRNESYMKIQLGLINQEAQQSAELENTDYTTFSDPKSLFGNIQLRDMQPTNRICLRLMDQCTFCQRMPKNIGLMDIRAMICFLVKCI